MSLTDLIGTIQISEQVRGGVEPAEMVTFRVDAEGFHEAGSGVGGSGSETGTISAPEAAAVFAEHFDAAKLRPLLAHLAELHDALSGGGS